MMRSLSLEPTSLSTVNPWPHSRAMSSHFSAGSSVMVPSETSTCDRPSSRSHATRGSTRPSRMAISVSVPPSTTGMPCSRKRSSLGARLAVASAVPQPSLTMSTLSPATSTSPSTWASDRPRSSTCVSPVVRGLPLRGGRSNSPAMTKATLAPLVRGVLPDDDHDLGVRPGRRLVVVVQRDDLGRGDPDRARAHARLRGVAGPELDLGLRLGLVGRVGDVADGEALLLDAVGHVARQAGDRGPVEHGDIGL